MIKIERSDALWQGVTLPIIDAQNNTSCHQILCCHDSDALFEDGVLPYQANVYNQFA